MALAQRTLPKGSKSAYGVGILGVFGAALFFGDGVITPAISVLSALEGLEVVAPQLSNWIVPLTGLVLVARFASQRFGPEKGGKGFGAGHGDRKRGGSGTGVAVSVGHGGASIL